MAIAAGPPAVAVEDRRTISPETALVDPEFRARLLAALPLPPSALDEVDAPRPNATASPNGHRDEPPAAVVRPQVVRGPRLAAERVGPLSGASVRTTMSLLTPRLATVSTLLLLAAAVLFVFLTFFPPDPDDPPRLVGRDPRPTGELVAGDYVVVRLFRNGALVYEDRSVPASAVQRYRWSVHAGMGAGAGTRDGERVTGGTFEVPATK